MGGAYYLGNEKTLEGTNAQPIEGAIVVDNGLWTPKGQHSDPKIVATWQSTSDKKFTRQFTANGKVTDEYKDEPTAELTGTYTIIDTHKEAVPNIPAESLSGMTVYKVTWSDNDVTYFGVTDISDASLSTVDLSGNGKATIYKKTP